MIAYLKGIIAEIADNHMIVEVSGVGYLVFASSKTLGSLNKGEGAIIYTEMVIREDSHTLYGFASKGEQSLFKLLTTVQGVGPKVCLQILSSLSASEINQAIISGDTKLIGKANGVGPKLALRIITELKGKVESSGVVSLSTPKEAQVHSDFEDAVTALVGLGYYRSEAVLAVDKVVANTPDLPLSKIIKQALKEMDRK